MARLRVLGASIFGVLLDVAVSDTIVHFILQGCLLARWALWLVRGPLVEILWEVVEGIRSFTTDLGIESRLTDFENVATAVLHLGTVSTHVPLGR
jgi:hypothetical protein